MKRIIFALITGLLMLSSCSKDQNNNVVVSNNNLEGTYKGVFTKAKGHVTETVAFYHDKTFKMTQTSHSSSSTISGTYTYDAKTKSGILHHPNHQNEDFTCTDHEIHIGNNVYCNHAEHQNGHHNNHCAGNHNGNIDCEHEDGHGDGHEDGDGHHHGNGHGHGHGGHHG